MCMHLNYRFRRLSTYGASPTIGFPELVFTVFKPGKEHNLVCRLTFYFKGMADTYDIFVFVLHNEFITIHAPAAAHYKTLPLVY